MIPRIIEAKAIEPFLLHLRFADGTAGEVHLSHLAGKGIFKAWDDFDFFKKVEIDAESGAVCWGKDIDLDPLVLYAALLKKPVETILSKTLA